MIILKIINYDNSILKKNIKQENIKYKKILRNHSIISSSDIRYINYDDHVGNYNHIKLIIINSSDNNINKILYGDWTTHV